MKMIRLTLMSSEERVLFNPKAIESIAEGGSEGKQFTWVNLAHGEWRVEESFETVWTMIRQC